MLIRLKIQNLILVDLTDIRFDNGLNIITGETGAGKSAILSAIRLITGDRSDSGLVGKNGDIAVIEAFLSTFSIPKELTPPRDGEALIIRREIHKSGRSRCFAGDEQISLSQLRAIVGSSIELIDQSSSQILCSFDEQRHMLDLFGDTLDLAKRFSLSFNAQMELQKRLEALLQASETRNRDLLWAEEDLALLDKVNWQKNEEEALTQEHHLLTHSQELLEKMSTLSNLLSEQPIKRAISILDTCAKLDSSLTPISTQLKNANCEIEDVKSTIHSFLTRLEADPNRLDVVEARMKSIDQIKRRFGKTFDLVQEKKREISERIDQLSHLDQELISLQTALKKKTEENQALADELSKKRRKAAIPFSEAILKELQTLNLPQSQFHISFEDTPLTANGIDSIRYLFSANAGHSPISIELCASGGELSRLLFSIKVTLVNKEKTDCLIFDEIDSNVGGQTATILGEKLKTIAQKRQVICVTHFIQVAKAASSHFLVTKNERQGQTRSQISKLSDQEKNEEYQRMLGNNILIPSIK